MERFSASWWDTVAWGREALLPRTRRRARETGRSLIWKAMEVCRGNEPQRGQDPGWEASLEVSRLLQPGESEKGGLHQWKAAGGDHRNQRSFWWKFGGSISWSVSLLGKSSLPKLPAALALRARRGKTLASSSLSWFPSGSWWMLQPQVRVGLDSGLCPDQCSLEFMGVALVLECLRGNKVDLVEWESEGQGQEMHKEFISKIGHTWARFWRPGWREIQKSETLSFVPHLYSSWLPSQAGEFPLCSFNYYSALCAWNILPSLSTPF